MCIVSHSSGYLSFNHNDYKYKNILFSDSNFLSMFGSSLVQGNPIGMLTAPLQIILSEHTAHTIFGNTNPINQTIQFWKNDFTAVSYTHLRAHETVLDLVCRLLLEKK